jgi:hypothetical protein
MTEEWITVAEYARRKGYSTDTAWARVNGGDVVSHKDGRLVRIPWFANEKRDLDDAFSRADELRKQRTRKQKAFKPKQTSEFQKTSKPVHSKRERAVST